jgi:hypothetical protein
MSVDNHTTVVSATMHIAQSMHSRMQSLRMHADRNAMIGHSSQWLTHTHTSCHTSVTTCGTSFCCGDVAHTHTHSCPFRSSGCATKAWLCVQHDACDSQLQSQTRKRARFDHAPTHTHSVTQRHPRLSAHPHHHPPQPPKTAQDSLASRTCSSSRYPCSAVLRSTSAGDSIVRGVATARAPLGAAKHPQPTASIITATAFRLSWLWKDVMESVRFDTKMTLEQCHCHHGEFSHF